MRIALTLCVVAAGLAALALAPRAEASCAELPPLERSLADARVVFVGTAVHVENRGRTATFRVEEVWKGRVERTTIVHGGPTKRNVATSVDRAYRTGTRYLLVPVRARPGVAWDNICSATRVYSPGLDELRPVGAAPPEGGNPPGPDAAPPAPTDTDASQHWLVVGLTLAGAAIVAAASLGLARRRTRLRG